MFSISKTYTFSMLIAIFSLNCFAELSWNATKQNILEVSVKNHDPILSYSEARKHLFGAIHLKKDQSGYFVKDVYCGKIIRSNVGQMQIPDHAQINCEHTWPQSRFSNNESKSIQKSDLHHLYPTDSRANSIRGNVVFGEVESNNEISNCEDSSSGSIIGAGSNGFEPPSEHKGNVARSLFYFSIRYKIEIPDHEEEYLRKWNNLDPVDDEEIARNDAVEKVQGNRNPFIDNQSLADMVTDF